MDEQQERRSMRRLNTTDPKKKRQAVYFAGSFVLPDELEDDPETRQLYEKAIKEGHETDRTIRVMVIGCFGQGKTTLVQRLKGESADNITSTDGIVVHRCISEARETSRWTNVLTEENVTERIASLAVAASSRESNRQSIFGSFSASSSNTFTQLCGQHASHQIQNATHQMQPATNQMNHATSQIHQATRVSLRGKEDLPSEPTRDDDKNRYKWRNRYSKICQQFGPAYEQLKHVELNCASRKKISLWDFGGQYIYYATHQLFHSSNAVYLLVFNLSLPLDSEINEEDYPGKSTCKTMKDYIIFWMHSIHSFVGRSDGKQPVVILVGTHRDKLQNDEQAERYFEAVRDLFGFSQLRYHIYSKHFAVSLADDANYNVDDLRAAILKVAQTYESKRVIPANWVLLECELNKYVQKSIISFQKLVDINKTIDYPLQSENQLKLFLKFHHSKGTYFYFDEGEMANHVVVNPEFVIDAFRSIIRAKRFCQQEQPDLVPLWNKLSDAAILQPELFRRIWRDKDSGRFSENEDLLVSMFKKHRIIAEVMKYEDKKDLAILKPRGFYIVPSLLKRADDGKIEEFLNGKTRSTVSILYSFHLIGIVGTIFQRILAAAIGTWPVLSYIDCLMVFDNGGIFELDLDHAGLIVLENENIELCVVNLCPENSVAVGMGDYFRRFVEVVIRFEFSKFKRNDLEIQFTSSFDVNIRCHHKDHINEGSRQMLSLKKIQEHTGERIRCPDSKSHSLKKKDVQKDWFQQKRKVDQFPAHRLNSKEFSKLACAIGAGWETLGLQLGVNPIKIQHLHMDNNTTATMIYQILQYWDEKNAEQATFDVLVKELEKLPDTSVNWEVVYNLKDNFYKLR